MYSVKIPTKFSSAPSLHFQQPCVSLLLSLSIRLTCLIAFPVMCCSMCSKRVPHLLSSGTELAGLLLRAGGLNETHLHWDTRHSAKFMRREARNCGKWESLEIFSVQGRAVDTRWATMIMQVLLTGSWHAFQVVGDVLPTRREKLYFLNQLSSGLNFIN